MVTKTVMDPEERRRELLACAMRLFAEEGYDNVSVRAVARAAGVAPGLAYHYFDSKEKMFAEAIEDYARRCAEGICELLDDNDLSLDEKLERALELGASRRLPLRRILPRRGARRPARPALARHVRSGAAAPARRARGGRGQAGTRRRLDADELAAIMVYACGGPRPRARACRTRLPSRPPDATSARCSPSSARGEYCGLGDPAPAAAGALFGRLY